MNKKILIVSLIALTGALLYLGTQDSKVAVDLDRSEMLGEFNTFRSTFGKKYQSLSEMEYRMSIFQEKLEQIRRHNADETQTYKLGINQFSDLTFDEFSAYYLSEDKNDRFVAGQDTSAKIVWVQSDERAVDWRKLNIVNKVKNQGNCGSCWAFSAVSVVEEAYALFKKDGIPTLAEQELVDCSTSYGNDGCDGGFSFQGLDYIRDKGINLEKDYPYKARDGQCKDISGKGAFKIKEWIKVEAGPNNMVDILRKQPTTASFHVQGDFMSYKSGVYNPKSCPGNRNHAVNAIGFDLDAEVPYFIVRNSWGPKWGEEGFFKIAIKDENGTCWFNGEGRTTFPVLE